MSILYLLIPLALSLSAGAALVFWWATHQGQFDDLETPALRILMDENPRPSITETKPCSSPRT